jgi:hypothetical protein
LQGAIEKTVILMLVLWVYCLYWSLFYGFLSFVSFGVFFLSLVRSPLLSLYKASGSLGGGNGWPPKCSVIDAFNEENVRLGRAVAEYRDDEVELSLQNDPLSWF